MKFIISILFSLQFLVRLQVFCQNYPPINNHSAWLVNATAWNYSTHFWIIDEKDTLINSISYRKYIEQGYEYPMALVREDVSQKRVYRYINNNEELLFDFSLHLADSIILANASTYHVVTEDSIEVASGEKRRRLILNHYAGSSINTYEVWVEGVGTMHYPLKPFYELITDPYFSIICSYQNGINVFSNGTNLCAEFMHTGSEEKRDFKRSYIYPNPLFTSTIVYLSCWKENASVYIYDGFGKVIYVQDHLYGQSFLIERAGIPAGVYSLKVIENNTSNSAETYKLLVKDD